MAVRFNTTLPDDLNEQVDRVAGTLELTKTEVIRRALNLYLVANEGQRKGLKEGLVKDEDALVQRFVGL